MEVDLAAIRHNVRVIRRRLGPGVRFMAVVKANGYGHGAVEVARTALEVGASYLGVATVDEAVELRKAGLDAPILVLGPVLPEGAEAAVKWDVTATVFSDGQVDALARECLRQRKKGKVHVKVDTGMGRIGLRHPQEVISLCSRVLSGPLELEGVYTHFACAEEETKHKASWQLKAFQEVLAIMEQAGIKVGIRHAANSAAALEFPESHLDMVRVGIAMYGYHPRPGTRGLDLRPALTWKARVVQVKRLPHGTPIGYGWSYTTRGEEIIATVCVGYADGYRRGLSDKGWVLVRGKKAPVVGRVCMDQLMVRLDQEVEPGEEVVLLGCQSNECISADNIGDWLDTISYEVLTSIGERVPRVYAAAY
ncbi:MAG: alanine racemase [Bacillota bacterium]